jgi:hypothetical protein
MRLHQNQVNMTNVLGQKADGYLVKLNNCIIELTHPHLEDNHFRSVQNCRMLEPYTIDESGEHFRRDNFLSVEIPMNERSIQAVLISLVLQSNPVSYCSQVASTEDFQKHNKLFHSWM